MTDSNFVFDVFLSYSSKDKPTVRSIAERLRADGLRVWFDEWEIRPGDSIPPKIEEGLEYSRLLVLCLSANAFGSDWTALESQTFRFRDPLNKERRFIPVRLDTAPIKGSLSQFLYIDWLPKQRESEYLKLLAACRAPAQIPSEESAPVPHGASSLQLETNDTEIRAYSFSIDGTKAISGGVDKTLRLWNLPTTRHTRRFEGHRGVVQCVALSRDGRRALSGADGDTLRLWDVETGACLRTFDPLDALFIQSVEWSSDQQHAITGSVDDTVRLWDVSTGNCLRVCRGHKQTVISTVLSHDQRHALSGSRDGSIRLWDLAHGKCLRVLEGHESWVNSVTWGEDEQYALSGSNDGTLRLWDLKSGRCLHIFEGHTGHIMTVSWNAMHCTALSGSGDGTVRLWDIQTRRCLNVFHGHEIGIRTVSWSGDAHHAFSGDSNGGLRVWDMSEWMVEEGRERVHSVGSRLSFGQVQYTNAKVLIVGETGAGKTGLSKVIAGEEWNPSDSTVGAWATQLKLPVTSDDAIEREIWLWDFGGQADQRLIHQLYMDDTALAVLVFDGQKEDLFDTLGQWDRDLTRASGKSFSKLLVAGRIDAGGLRVSRSQLEAFARERGFTGPLLETSAKVGTGCNELKEAILRNINWEDIPWRSSPGLFKRLKEEIVRLKDAGRVLMRFNELRETLTLRLSGEGDRFTDDELKAVITLLAGPGVVWELKFGSWLLLQPERINSYAQAVIQTMREDEHERGCLLEQRVLNGELSYHSSLARLEPDEERFILLAMHQTLVERGLCLRQETEKGAMLIFPSYYRRERPELVGHPAVLVSYRFIGFLDDIYATLVVRLHHTESVQKDQLWRYAADFRTLTGKQFGVKVIRRSEGAGELEVYFDPSIAIEEKIIFSKYVHEHLLKSAKEVVRLRHYVCPHCGTSVGNREVAMKRLDAWLGKSAKPSGKPSLLHARRTKPDRPTIICAECEKRVQLWDELEQHFASPETKQRVRELEEQSEIQLDSESKERALVGDVISTVALAGQLSREFNVSDHGIDMEIEFKSDEGEATGQKLYLQLKSGDSYLRHRTGDGAEVFQIKDDRHVRYWMSQQFPVLLVIRNSEGEIRWMEMRDYLRRESDNGRKTVKQIVFDGQRFDVMSVRRLRDEALRTDLPS